jgi:methyl-accepting chemotaxis protein
MTSSDTRLPDHKQLVELCAGVLPVWLRHLAASRAQSETAVTQMLKAFSDINPHISRAERQSEQITEALNQSDEGITGLAVACERALSGLRNDPSTSDAGKAAIDEVLSKVKSAVDALENIAKPFTHETQMVAEQVELMYVSFQYQDRISQMMTLLESDFTRLESALAGKDDSSIDLTDWLARLESQYAMAEQRHNHTGTGGSGDSSDDEMTFF